MDAFIGEIRALPFTFVPYGWILCDGQNLNINQYQALFAVISYQYNATPPTGTFSVPNLLGKTGVGAGTGPGLTPRTNGQAGGTETVQLTAAQIPIHTHSFTGAVGGANFRKPVPSDTTFYLTNTGYGPTGATTFTAASGYTGTMPSIGLNPASISSVGGVAATNTAAPHENKQPYLTLMYCICYNGNYPSRS